MGEEKIVNKKSSLVNGSAASRIGGRKENQDSYGYLENDIAFIATVCDGMGGGPGGKTASSIAVREILKVLGETTENADIEKALIDAVSVANNAIREEAELKPELKGMGSTCTILYLTPDCAWVAHVGDSRVYQFRDRSKVFRTFDHSMVFDLVRQKLITEEQARLSADSNIITRALGTKPEVEPSISKLPYLKGDRFLLCTDGIHGTMPEKDLIKLATRHNQAIAAVADDIAVRVDDDGRKSGGGHDNLTLMLIDTLQNSKIQSKMTKISKLIILILAVIGLCSIAWNIVQISKNSELEKLINDDKKELKMLNDSILKMQKTQSMLIDSLKNKNK